MKAVKASSNSCPLKLFSFADALCVAVLSVINASFVTTVVLVATISDSVDTSSLFRICMFTFAVSVAMLSIGVMIERKHDIKEWHIANDKESNETPNI